MQIAIPAFRLSCNVGIDKGRAWSVIDEMILWATAHQQRSIAHLSADSGLPRQIIVASIARLMRFRLIELTVQSNGAAFRASEYGKEVVASGRPLPFFPKRDIKRVSFVIERATGGFFPTGQVRMFSETALLNEAEPDLRVVVVEGGGPSMSHEANFSRLSKIAARGWEEQVALVDGRTSSLRTEYMMIRVVDGVPRNVPESASLGLRAVIDKAASLPAGTTQVAVGYGGSSQELELTSTVHECQFDPADLVVGGSAQLECLRNLLASADSRVIIHSTFLDHRRFKDLFADIRAACLRGVTFDMLWGAESLDEEETRNSASAVEIAKMVREDRDVARRFHVHMRSTGSHAKILLVDTTEGDWIAAIGSCNWLSTPFRAVELTAVLRDPAVVADVAVAVQRMVGRRGLSDDIATEMAIVARDLRRHTPKGGSAKISLIFGDGHDVLMRTASGAASRRVVVGSHRLGSTARPGVVIQAETAVERAKVNVTLLYTMPSGPLKNRHARKLAEEAAANGVRLVKTGVIPLHGKFVAWDDDDLVVTSLNWASASGDLDFPQADIGAHIVSPGIADYIINALECQRRSKIRPMGGAKPGHLWRTHESAGRA
jgi:cardiolipin synthase